MIPKEAQELLNEIEALNFKPKGMDYSLIQSVKKNIAMNKLSSKGQADWLIDIYAKATGGGVYQKRSYV